MIVLSFWSDLLFSWITIVVLLHFIGFGLWDLFGLGHLLGLLKFWFLFNFCKELILKKLLCAELFWTGFSYRTLFRKKLFENDDLLFSTPTEFDSACLFSMRDLISNFKAFFASSFGEKNSQFVQCRSFSFEKSGLRYGSWWGVIGTLEFMTSGTLSNFKLVYS